MILSINGQLRPVSSYQINPSAPLDLFNKSEELSNVVDLFCQNPLGCQRTLMRDGHLASGGHSEVSRIDNFAVKISTGSTGRQGHWSDGQQSPENLANQYHFLDWFGKFIRSRHILDIKVPDQVFYVQAKSGEYLKIEQLVAGNVTLDQYFNSHQYDDEDFFSIRSAIKNKIIKSIGGGLIGRLALLELNDLGLPKNHPLRTDNIMIDPDCLDPTIEPITIIDQPQSSILRSLAFRALI